MLRLYANERWVLLLIFAVGLICTSHAQQFDGPYYNFLEKNKNKWADEDQRTNAKLADLVKKFGKKPNIIFILTDDIGWREPGWQYGGKGSILEGGVRTPEFARWPGMIEGGRDPLDIIHVTDMFTTAAHIGGAIDKIPNERITDDIDQTTFLPNGEGHGRRNYMVHYAGSKVGALRLEEYKAVIGGGAGGGTPTFEMYNVVRGPGEKSCKLNLYLWFVQPVNDLMESHMQMIRKFPHETYEQ